MLPLFFIMLAVVGLAGAATAVYGNYVFSKRIAIIASGITLVLAIYLLFSAIYTNGFIGTAESLPYISQFGIYLSFVATVPGVVLTLLAAIVSLVASITVSRKFEDSKNIYVLILLFEFSAIGLFLSANLFLFYVFWDVGVIASYFMINSFGSGERRHAANTFLIYSIFASALLLLAIMLIYFYTPVHSFDISYIASHSSSIPVAVQGTIFVLFFIAFMVKMPIFPFHSWISNAYAEAPAQGSMLISGVLSKFGAYGMLILFSMFAFSSEFAKYAFVLGTISAFYAAFVLMRQADLKRMTAYSSMLESGIILVGISSLNAFGTSGALYLMLAHGLVMALMFSVIGGIEISYGTRSINVLKGIVKQSAGTAYSFVIGTFASTGLPLTAGFIADVLVFIGAISEFGLYGAIPIFSIMLLGFYMYYAINKSFLSTKVSSNSIARMPKQVAVSYSIAMIALFAFGIFPFFITSLFGVGII
ncbi:MAG: NADH-quinone oxidoreductase subunit M [Candidatus Marsarchaeota archaeon]|nr:NADH-quinone oxidoreductase subunit M [Candidatus Marsarchaeota archaeon]